MPLWPCDCGEGAGGLIQISTENSGAYVADSESRGGGRAIGQGLEGVAVSETQVHLNFGERSTWVVSEVRAYDMNDVMVAVLPRAPWHGC